jgi:hypothetical protein
MSNQLSCAPHIYMTAVNEDVVVLDASAGQYHCLPDLGAVLTPTPDGRMALPPADLAEALVAAGLASWTPCPPRVIPMPGDRTVDPVDAPASLSLRAAMSLAASSLGFRGLAFPDLLTPVRVATRTDRRSPERLLSAGFNALPWLPGEGACLQRAWQLRRFFAAQGVSTTWVFGVRTWPFAAHCWLQIEDRVIGDRIERLRLYAPIMAV